MLKHKRTVITLFLILIFITVFRLTWFQLLTVLDVEEQPLVEKGVLDLRESELSTYKTFKLDGEWEFYPDQLLNEQKKNNQQFTTIPHLWNDENFKNKNSTIQYGTYRLKILLNKDDDHEEELGIRINAIENSSAVYVNDELISKTGNPATNSNEYIPKNIPINISVPVENNEIDLRIHVASHTNNGGIVKTIRFGTIEAINKRFIVSLGLQLFLIILFLVHSIYILLLYFVDKKIKGTFYYFIIMILGILTVVTVDDKILFLLIDFDYHWVVRITMLVYIIAISFSVPINNYLFPNYLSKKMLTLYQILIYILVTLILTFPTQWILIVKDLMGLLMIFPLIISAYIMWKATRDKQDIILFLYGTLILAVNIIWSIILNAYYIDYIFYPFDLMFSILAISIYWFNQFFKAKRDAENLAKKLQLEDKRKDEFLLSTSHELRNPLHGIVNIVQAMQGDKEEPLSIKQKNRTKVLMHVSHHLSMLVEDLLDISKLNDNAVKLNFQKLNFSTIVTGVYDMIGLSLGNKPITMEVDIAEDFPPIWGDEQRLIQVMFNLLHNAVKFTKKGKITTRAQVIHKHVLIQVEDTGIGISERDIDNIFKPYGQGSLEQSSNMIEGIGYGLYICKKLVELHDGEIKVYSVLGEGSTFSIKLPIVNENDQYKKQTTNVENSLKGSNDIDGNQLIYDQLKDINKLGFHEDQNHFSDEVNDKTNWNNDYSPKILVVDDDYINLKIFSNLLETERYTVFTSADVQTALDIIDKLPIDLVISDVMMPVTSGYEFTKIIRERYTLIELPILLVTARTRSEDIIIGLQSGANDYLTKPVNSLELKSRVKTLIKLKRSLEEHDQMQGAWLQAQIQPHFIFNTLNSIAALGVTDISKMQILLQEFSNYLRVSFDFKNSNPVVKLKHELELVKSYIYIQKERFEERLQVNWDIAHNIDFSIPPLSIQPLVENAINHGILNKTKGGIVKIQVKKEELYYRVIVSDNGIGMTEEKLESLFTKKENSTAPSRQGIGLKNLNKRLKQMYNQKLIIESKQNEGSTVSFRIPKNEDHKY